jgi:hypothetical protein
MEGNLSKLEAASHLALIAVCGVAVFVLGEQHFARSRSLPKTAQANVGSKIALDGPNWSVSRTNIVIGLRSGCRFCEESLPLYRHLVSLAQSSGGDISIYVVSPDPPEVTDAFLKKGDVEHATIYRANLAKVGILGTPTLFLVDSKGMVRSVVMGRLSDAGGDGLLQALKAYSFDTHLIK